MTFPRESLTEEVAALKAALAEVLTFLAATQEVRFSAYGTDPAPSPAPEATKAHFSFVNPPGRIDGPSRPG